MKRIWVAPSSLTLMKALSRRPTSAMRSWYCRAGALPSRCSSFRSISSEWVIWRAAYLAITSCCLLKSSVTTSFTER